MNWEKYIKMVIRNIKCSGKKKKEIKRELTSDITTALAAGEEWQSIMERMGTPAALAAEFNKSEPPQEKFMPISYKQHWQVVRDIDQAMGVSYACK